MRTDVEKRTPQDEVRKFAKRALAVALLVILTEVLFESFIVGIFKDQAPLLAFSLLFSYMFLQIVFSPMQSGVSDFIGRKKSLQISLSASFLSLIILLLYLKNFLVWMVFLFLATLIKGIAGNNLPLSLSVIADTQGKNYRFSFALSSGTYAVAFLAAIYASEPILNYILISLTVFLIFICITSYFKDIEDAGVKDKENSKTITQNNSSLQPEGAYSKKTSTLTFSKIIQHEPVEIQKDLKQKSTRQALTAFLLWEVSIYSMLISQIDFKIYLIPHLAALMMIGYITGVIILKFCSKTADSQMIKIGYYLSTISLVPYFFFWFFSFETLLVLQICFFLHSLGNALLSPTFMAILAKEKPPHEQGKRYGLVESTDTIAFLIGTSTVMLFKYLKVPLSGLISFAFFSFILSWRFYGRFKNLS